MVVVLSKEEKTHLFWSLLAKAKREDQATTQREYRELILYHQRELVRHRQEIQEIRKLLPRTNPAVPNGTSNPPPVVINGVAFPNPSNDNDLFGDSDSDSDFSEPTPNLPAIFPDLPAEPTPDLPALELLGSPGWGGFELELELGFELGRSPFRNMVATSTMAAFSDSKAASLYRRTPRIALRRHSESPFLYLFNSGNEQALLNCCGVDHTVFQELLGLFQPTFDSVVDRYTNAIWKKKVNKNGVWRGRKRKANATCCLGLVLHWFRTRGSVARSMSMAFVLTSTVMYKWLKFSRNVLLFVLQNHPKAMIRLPTKEELEEYISVIGAKYPRLKERPVWGAANGLKSRYYNSWVCDTYVNSAFVFAVNERILICSYNCPGTWHDSTIADHGVYDEIEELFVKFQAMDCVDSSFRVATGRLKCLRSNIPLAVIRVGDANDAGATFGDRKVIFNLMMLLYNCQTSIIGHNQILTFFMHKKDRYFSYANNLPEHATGIFE
eukprot:jgi/Psemu1/22223/gm1.22223_g